MLSDKYEDTYGILMHMAKAKLTMNAHKKLIEDVNPEVLISLARGELDELEEAIKSGNTIHITEEAADVTNFVMAAVHQALNKYRNRKNVENTGHNESKPHQTVDNRTDCCESISGRAYFQRNNDCKGNCEICEHRR